MPGRSWRPSNASIYLRLVASAVFSPPCIRSQIARSNKHGSIYWRSSRARFSTVQRERKTSIENQRKGRARGSPCRLSNHKGPQRKALWHFATDIDNYARSLLCLAVRCDGEDISKMAGTCAACIGRCRSRADPHKRSGPFDCYGDNIEQLGNQRLIKLFCHHGRLLDNW